MTNDTTGNSVLVVGQIPTSGDAATDVENYANSQITASSVLSEDFNGFTKHGLRKMRARERLQSCHMN